MNAPIVYLDSSAIIKRYLEEPGSKAVRDLYIKTYSGETRIAYSIWNIGEVLGVLDRAKRLDRINDREYSVTRKRFLGETRRMLKLGIALALPLKVTILREAWRTIERQHLYMADALQIATAKHVNSEKFLTSDRKLYEAALAEGLDSVLLT